MTTAEAPKLGNFRRWRSFGGPLVLTADHPFG
jgi:hypothetical protein